MNDVETMKAGEKYLADLVSNSTDSSLSHAIKAKSDFQVSSTASSTSVVMMADAIKQKGKDIVAQYLHNN